MDYFDLTLRFDDLEHAMTSKNGLTIDKLSELLMSLAKAVSVSEKNPVVLSQIKGNCYALNISTPTVTTFETLKVIHSKIARNDYRGLNTDQRKYASKLKAILSDKFSFQVYSEDKEYFERVDEIILPAQPQVFYETTSIFGVVTSIGGSRVDGKTYIHVSKVPYDIEITNKQESELIQLYKKCELRLVVCKKISSEKHEILSASLESFEPSQSKSTLSPEQIRNSLPEELSEYLLKTFYQAE